MGRKASIRFCAAVACAFAMAEVGAQTFEHSWDFGFKGRVRECVTYLTAQEVYDGDMIETTDVSEIFRFLSDGKASYVEQYMKTTETLYTDAGDLKTRIIMPMGNAAEDEKRIVEYRKDADGSVVAIARSADGTETDRTESSYDGMGRLLAEKTFDGRGNLIYSRDLSYGFDGLESGSEYRDSAGEVLMITSMKYNLSGLRIVYEKLSADGDYLKILYSYNRQGDPVEESWYDREGTLTEICCYSYEYDAYGNWISCAFSMKYPTVSSEVIDVSRSARRIAYY